MDSTELKTLASEVADVIAAIPALQPYTAPISLALGIAAALAPPIYEEIKTLFDKAQAGEPIPETDVQRLQVLIASLKSADDYFAAGVASALPPAPPSLTFIR